MSRTSGPSVVRQRAYAVGAESFGTQGTHFRVWAPDLDRVSLVLENESGHVLEEHALEHEPDTEYASVFVTSAQPGSLYRFRLPSGLRPDPASRFQPRGPHGPSQVVDPTAFVWSDTSWRGVELQGQVLYELHVGTFTREGTWLAAIAHLSALAELGITVIEMMPVADFAGDRGWGYDGVNLFAPSRLYGAPDDLRRFIDAAHAAGLGVILDVVYNHLGPDGNFFRDFSPRYFATRHSTEWGDAINYDDNAGPVRELMLANAEHWIAEYRFDGLRFDATQQIFDDSSEHLLAEMSRRARAAAAHRRIILVAENERQDVRVLRSRESHGFGFDGIWNDDFHHAAVVAATGRREAYLWDYRGSPQEFISLAKWGFLFQGQRYTWQNAGRGTPAFGIEPSAFITFLDNHDQVANAPSGEGPRLSSRCDPALYRALTTLWLLSPGTPLFFQGQEFGATTPFLYFAGHAGDLGAAVRRGRAQFMSQFPSTRSRDLVRELPDPGAEDTFRSSQLNHAEADAHGAHLALHRDLLRLRQRGPFARVRGGWVDGAVLSADAFVLRWFASDPHARVPEPAHGLTEWLLLVNLGTDVRVDPAPEPLLAPPAGSAWMLSWSSEDPAYGGGGTPAIETDENWQIPGRSAVLMSASHR